MKDDEIVYSCYDVIEGKLERYTVAELKGLCNLLVNIFMQCPDEELIDECLMNIQGCETFYDENDEEYNFPVREVNDGTDDN